MHPCCRPQRPLTRVVLGRERRGSARGKKEVHAAARQVRVGGKSGNSSELLPHLSRRLSWTTRWPPSAAASLSVGGKHKEAGTYGRHR